MRDQPASPPTYLDADLSRLKEALDREIRVTETSGRLQLPSVLSRVEITASVGAWATAAVAIGAAGVWLATALPY